MHKLLSELLVNVPNVATLDLLEMVVELRVIVLSHVVLGKQISNERVSDVVVGFEVCDELGARRWKLLKDLASQGLLVTKHEYVLVMIGKNAPLFAASLLQYAVVVYKREILSKLRDACHAWKNALAVYHLNELVGQQTIRDR